MCGLIDQSVGWLVGLSVNRLVVGWLVGWLVVCFVLICFDLIRLGSLIGLDWIGLDWTDRPTDQPTDLFMGKLII